MKRPSIWKVVGLAGLAGVAATGVAVARSERQRRSYTPEEVRARLHDRLASMEAGAAPAEVGSRQLEGRRLRFLGRLNGRQVPSGEPRSKHV